MILYHYSVDSYSSGSTLINDYKKQFRFAEPFLLAPEKGDDCFWSVYFSAMSYSRELCALGLRKYENYVKDAVEGIFEYVRRQRFHDNSASRLGCVYYCDSREEAIAYLKEDCIDNGNFTLDRVKLLEVEVENDSIYRYDQSFYNEACDIMENERDLDTVKRLAEYYFSAKTSAAPLIEILSDGKNQILRELPIEL